jgi:RND family efflux transporter MFP subunit
MESTQDDRPIGDRYAFLRQRLASAATGRAGTFVLAIGLLGLMGIAGGAVLGTSAESLVEEPAPVLGVTTQPATLVSGYQVTRPFVGRVEARRDSRLSLELDGRLVHVLCDEGDFVRQGDSIAVLDTQILESQRQAVAAQLAAAESQLEEMLAGPRAEIIAAARAEVERWKALRRLAAVTQDRNAELVEQYAVSRQELDEATFREQSVEAQQQTAEARLLELENGTRKEQIASQRAIVAQLQAELGGIDVRLKKSTLRSPYTGVVAERFIDEGTVIAAGTPVVRLLETGQLDLRVGVTEDVVSQLERGSKHQVLVNGITCSAVVRAVRPDRDPMTRTVSVLFDLQVGDQRIHIGDLATLRIRSRLDRPGFWIPISALTASYRGLWACYVAAPDPDPADSREDVRTLQLRELELIHQTSDSAFVRGSLQDGEAVVNAGIQRLVPGQRVRRLPE